MGDLCLTTEHVDIHDSTCGIKVILKDLIIKTPERNCQSNSSEIVAKSLHPSCTLAHNSEIKKIEYFSWH